jgi:hypothetical protein
MEGPWYRATPWPNDLLVQMKEFVAHDNLRFHTLLLFLWENKKLMHKILWVEYFNFKSPRSIGIWMATDKPMWRHCWQVENVSGVWSWLAFLLVKQIVTSYSLSTWIMQWCSRTYDKIYRQNHVLNQQFVWQLIIKKGKQLMQRSFANYSEKCGDHL